LLPFEQLAHGPVHPEGLLAIEIGLQTGRDFANQAAEAHKALQLGIVGHSRPPDELAAGNATVVLRATQASSLLGRVDRRAVGFYGGQWASGKFSMTVAAR
jgi:hypothetical protein